MHTTIDGISEGQRIRVSSALAFLDAEVMEFEREGKQVRVEFSTRYSVVRVGGIILDYSNMIRDASPPNLFKLLDLIKLIVDSHDAVHDHLATRH